MSEEISLPNIREKENGEGGFSIFVLQIERSWKDSPCMTDVKKDEYGISQVHIRICWPTRRSNGSLLGRDIRRVE